MDILANTDFPDVRQKCLISSASEGNILVLPREGGYVFRMYVELDKLRPDEKAAQKKFTQDDMIAAANPRPLLIILFTPVSAGLNKNQSTT